MEFEKLKSAASEIIMPDEMKQHIVKNCTAQIINSRKEVTMESKHHPFFRKHASILAVLTTCIFLSVTALATTESIQGFFRDITDFRGTVVGTTYEQATDEIYIYVTADDNLLYITAAFTDPQQMPYCYAEELGIAAFRIVDPNGAAVKEGAAEACEILNGQTQINIPLDGIESGSYKLIISAFVSQKKADQPLTISGNWECGFTK